MENITKKVCSKKGFWDIKIPIKEDIEMMILLNQCPDSDKLGANHSALGLRGLNLSPGTYDDVVVIPEGKFLRLEHGEDREDGALFVGRSYYNYSFMTKISGQMIPRSVDCGCSKEFIEYCRKNAYRDEIHDHKIPGTVLVRSTEGFGERCATYEYRAAAIELPNAVLAADWEARDSAGADEVAYWAIRLKGSQTAYVIQSGYKGRRDWNVRILKADGSVEYVSRDELRGRVHRQRAL